MVSPDRCKAPTHLACRCAKVARRLREADAETTSEHPRAA